MRPAVRFACLCAALYASVRRPIKYFIATGILCASLGHTSPANADAPSVPDFNRDIRPILSENCFQCHGFDPEQRQADLRLDISGSVTEHFVERILSEDPSARMPPPDSHRSLTSEQRALLVAWAKAGAVYERHWAFTPIEEGLALEQVGETNSEQSRWQKNPVDRYVLQTLHKQNLAPRPPTTPEKWLRRASLDLLGLAPGPTEVDVFLEQVKQRGEPAYEEAIDAMFTSPRYGERMATDWLDLARYADTHGFNNDSERSMWRWRDWVIDAYNSNMPYDQFILKQLAGDLIPDATLEDHIATGFCRNHGINSEGGIIDEEYRVEYVVDRVRTLGTGILGLTLECARCHDHKFDPISQREFFSLYAFFNQVDEIGEDGRDKNAFPLMRAPTKDQQIELKKLDQRIAVAQSKLHSIRESRSNR